MEVRNVPTKVERRTVDLSQFPELVVIYLGMRVNRYDRTENACLDSAQRSRPRSRRSLTACLLHENMIYSLFPAHVGMRQYWRDMDSLTRVVALRPASRMVEELSARLGWHRLLARDVSDAGGIEAIYDDLPQPIGMMNFAPLK